MHMTYLPTNPMIERIVRINHLTCAMSIWKHYVLISYHLCRLITFKRWWTWIFHYSSLTRALQDLLYDQVIEATIMWSNYAMKTMGGSIICHDPDTSLLKDDNEVWRVFQATRWTIYIEILHGFNEEVSLQFSLSLLENKAQDHRLLIIVDGESIFVVIGMSWEGEWCFSQKNGITRCKIWILGTRGIISKEREWVW